MSAGVIMPLVVPDVTEVILLNLFLNAAFTIRIFGNNAVPGPLSVTASFTEIAGGGYVNKPLTFANWAVTAGSPSVALYAKQSWTFTGAINAPGTIYGYYVTRDSDGLLMWAELFPAASIPFIPALNSLVEITPRFTGGSVF
jgi:hypothetical protein